MRREGKQSKLVSRFIDRRNLVASKYQEILQAVMELNSAMRVLGQQLDDELGELKLLLEEHEAMPSHWVTGCGACWRRPAWSTCAPHWKKSCGCIIAIASTHLVWIHPTVKLCAGKPVAVLKHWLCLALAYRPDSSRLKSCHRLLSAA